MEDEKLTIDQLAEKIKSKYPAYNDMDNTILVEKIIAKYPVYKDQLIEGSLKKKEGVTGSDVGVGSLESQDTNNLTEGFVDTAVEVAEPQITAAEQKEIQNKIPGETAQGIFSEILKAGKQGSAQGRTVDETIRLFAQGNEIKDENLDDYISAVEELRKLPSTEAMTKFQKEYQEGGGDLSAFSTALMNNKAVIPELFAQSTTAMVSPNVLGPAVGAAGVGGIATGLATGGVGALPAAAFSGIFTANVILEGTLAVTEFLEEELRKRELSFDREGIRSILQNQDALDNIRMRALGRGVAIGLVESIFGGLAGKATKPLTKLATKVPTKLGRGVSKVVLPVAGATTIETIGGSAGEVAGRVVAGQEMDVAEIGLEGIAGLPGAAVPLGISVLQTATSPGEYVIKGSKGKGQKVNRRIFRKFLKNATDEDIVRGDTTFSVKDDSKVEAELIRRQEEARIRIDFKKQYPTISQEDLNEVVPLQLQLQDAKNSPINTQEKEAVLEKEINLITKKYADQIKSPAKILDEEQSTAGETVAKRDDQSTELAGETTQAEKETTDQPGQTPEIETEVSETQEVRYTLPEDPKEARKDFEIIDNRDGKAGLEIEEDGLGNWVVRNKKTDKLTYTKTKKQAQQELKDLDWDYGEGDIIEVEKTVTETKSAPDVIKGVIKTDGDIIIQRFTKQRGGRTQQNALAPVSVLDEFDIDLEANGIEGVEIVAVKEIRRTKDGKRNFAKIIVRDGDAQFTAEVSLTPKKPAAPQAEAATEARQTAPVERPPLQERKELTQGELNQFKRDRERKKIEKKKLEKEAETAIKKIVPEYFTPSGKLKSERQMDDAKVQEVLSNNRIVNGILKLGNQILDVLNRTWRKTGGNSLYNLETITSLMDASGSTFFQDNLYRRLAVADEVYKRGIRTQADKIDNLKKSIEGFNSKTLAGEIMIEGIKDRKNTPFTKEEALKIYALYQNPAQRERLQKVGFDDQKIKLIEEQIGPAGIEYANRIIDYLDGEYYTQVNDLYKKLNQKNLPKVERYFPVRSMSKKQAQKILADPSNFADNFSLSTITALIERTDKGEGLLYTGDFSDVLANHFSQIEKYKAYAQAVEDINTIVQQPAVDTYLKYSDKGLGIRNLLELIINNQVNPMAFGIAYQNLDLATQAYRRYAEYSLGFKPIQVLKQASSFPAAFVEYKYKPDSNTFTDTVMFAVDMMKTAIELVNIFKFKDNPINKMINISESFRDRVRQGFLMGDVYALESGGENMTEVKNKSRIAKLYNRLRQAGAGFTILGDILGIMGYYTNYKRDIANGMSEAEALEKFNNYNKTQQTRRPIDKSKIQLATRNPQNVGDYILKALTQFRSVQFLYINQFVQVVDKIVKDIKAGGVQNVKPKDVRKFVMFPFIGTALWKLASHYGKLLYGDDEDRRSAMGDVYDALKGLDVWYSIPLYGEAIQLANYITVDRKKSRIREKIKKIRNRRSSEYKNLIKELDALPKVFRPKGGLNPFSETIRKVNKEITKGDGIQTVLEIVKPLTGINIDPFVGMSKIAKDKLDIPNDEEYIFEDSFFDILGIPESQRPETDKKKK